MSFSVAKSPFHRERKALVALYNIYMGNKISE